MLSYTFNSKKMLADFGTNIKINVALLSEAYPQIASKYSFSEDLDIEVSIKNPRIVFAPT
jgi:hypothetical protein